MQQQSVDSFSVSRRALDIEDYVDIMQRHRAWILGPTLVGLVLGVVVAYLWPDTFVSWGSIRILPPRVSQTLMQQPLAEQLSTRMNSIYQTVTQRSNLTNLIQQYNLYPDERKGLPMEDVVEKMKTDIKMGTITSLSALAQGQRNFAFTVTYKYPDRRLAYKVCTDIISSFINESERTGSANLTQTQEFFRDQYDQAKKDLEEIERRITEFKTKNVGGSPEEEAMLANRISNLEAAVQNLIASQSRLTSEKMLLETELRTKTDALQAATAPVVLDQAPAQQQQRNEELMAAEREVRQLEAYLAGLRERYLDTHPDVQAAEAALKVSRAKRDRLASEAANQSPKADPNVKPRVVAPNPNSPQIRALQGEVSRLRTLIQSKDLELDDISRQLKEHRDKIRALNQQLDMSPAAQQRFTELQRERDRLQANFERMSDKVDASRIAGDVEARKQGETLEALDPPFMPTEATYPKRGFIVGGGLAGGLLLGLLLTGIREMKDTSLKNLKDVRAYTKLTVLASIPLLENDVVVRRRRRLTWLGWSAASVVSVLLMAGAVIYYITSKT